MPTSQWHKLYTSLVAAPPGVLFGLLADMPAYGRWLPGSSQYGQTTDVEPYPVRRAAATTTGNPASRAKTGGARSPGSSPRDRWTSTTRLR